MEELHISESPLHCPLNNSSACHYFSTLKREDFPLQVKYLFPCKCGQRLTVEPRQAGEIIVCTCGQSHEIPTLLQLKKLEPLIVEDDFAPSAWGLAHGLILLGIVILICCTGLASCLLFLVGPPQSPFSRKSPEAIYEMAQNLSPREAWRIWISLREYGFDPQKHWMERRFFEKVAEYKVLWILLVPVFLLGATFIISGIVALRRKRKQRATVGRAPP
jgi:hypothetical protein